MSREIPSEYLQQLLEKDSVEWAPRTKPKRKNLDESEHDWEQFLVEQDRDVSHSFNRKDFSHISDIQPAQFQKRQESPEEEKSRYTNKRADISMGGKWDSRLYGERDTKKKQYREKKVPLDMDNQRDRPPVRYIEKNAHTNYRERDNRSDFTKSKQSYNSQPVYVQKIESSQRKCQNNSGKEYREVGHTSRNKQIPQQWLEEGARTSVVESFPGQPCWTIKFGSTRIQLISGRALQIQKDFIMIPFEGGHEGQSPPECFQRYPTEELIKKHKCQIPAFLNQKKENKQYRVDDRAICMKSQYSNYKGIVLVDVSDSLAMAIKSGLSELMHVDLNFKSLLIPYLSYENMDCQTFIRTIFEYFYTTSTCLTDVTICIHDKDTFLECIQAFSQSVLALKI